MVENQREYSEYFEWSIIAPSVDLAKAEEILDRMFQVLDEELKLNSEENEWSSRIFEVHAYEGEEFDIAEPWPDSTTLLIKTSEHDL